MAWFGSSCSHRLLRKQGGVAEDDAAGDDQSHAPKITVGRSVYPEPGLAPQEAWTYRESMSGQEFIALAVVAVTAGVFARSALQRRKRNAACGGGCGCAVTSGSKATLTVRGRKGEQPQLHVH